MGNAIRYHRIKCQDIIRYEGNDWITKELSSPILLSNTEGLIGHFKMCVSCYLNGLQIL